MEREYSEGFAINYAYVRSTIDFCLHHNQEILIDVNAATEEIREHFKKGGWNFSIHRSASTGLHVQMYRKKKFFKVVD